MGNRAVVECAVVDQQHEQRDILGLVLRLTAVALFLPLAAIALVWLYYSAQGHEIARTEWREVVFFSWLGTMLVVFRDAFSMSRRRTLTPWSWRFHGAATAGKETIRRSGSQVQKWEQKKTSRIIRELIGTVILVPILSCGMVWIYFYFIKGGLSRTEVRTVAVIVWLATLVCLFRIARKAGHDRLSYE